MKSQVPRQQARWDWWWVALCPLALGIGWAACLLAARPVLLLALAGGFLYLWFAALSFRKPLIFVMTFLVVLIALPPFYFSWAGETPVYISSVLAPIGVATLVTRLSDLRFRFDTLAKNLAFVLVGTGLSLPFACWLSGTAIGSQSFLRWLMLAQALLVYMLVRGAAPACESGAERWLVPILLVAAVVSAGYGIFDFYRPVSLPHPAADQFIWLPTAIIRRAQGVFYEAGNFANLCGFFLVFTSGAFLARQERNIRIGRPWLLLSMVILSLAVFVSFTRSAWACDAVALAVFTGVSRQVKLSRALNFLLALGSPLAILWVYSPELWNYLVSSRIGNLTQILIDPNLASSGRFETWSKALAIIQDHPQYLLFGVGYKTLPFTRLFHQELITDNGFLNLLLETGILGLAAFLLFSAAVLKLFWRLARDSRGELAFWSGLLFSFWCGELVQMMSVDAHTYWRNMVVFLATMAFVLNRAERLRLL